MMAQGRYRTVRLDLPLSLYASLELIAEEDDEPMSAIIVRAVGNYVHNRTT